MRLYFYLLPASCFLFIFYSNIFFFEYLISHILYFFYLISNKLVISQAFIKYFRHSFYLLFLFLYRNLLPKQTTGMKMQLFTLKDILFIIPYLYTSVKFKNLHFNIMNKKHQLGIL